MNNTMTSIISKVENFQKLELESKEEMTVVYAALVRELSSISSLIIDTEHIIEYCKVDAVKFTKIAKKLQNLFSERRRIKEYISFLDLIKSNHGKQISLILSEYSARKNQRYSKYLDESNKSLITLFAKV